MGEILWDHINMLFLVGFHPRVLPSFHDIPTWAFLILRFGSSLPPHFLWGALPRGVSHWFSFLLYLVDDIVPQGKSIFLPFLPSSFFSSFPSFLSFRPSFLPPLPFLPSFFPFLLYGPVDYFIQRVIIHYSHLLFWLSDCPWFGQREPLQVSSCVLLICSHRSFEHFLTFRCVPICIIDTSMCLRTNMYVYEYQENDLGDTPLGSMCGVLPRILEQERANLRSILDFGCNSPPDTMLMVFANGAEVQTGGWGGWSLTHSDSPGANSSCLRSPCPQPTHTIWKATPSVFLSPYHTLGGLKSRNFFSHHVLEVGSPKSRCREGLVPGEHSSQLADSTSSLPSHGLISGCTWTEQICCLFLFL